MSEPQEGFRRGLGGVSWRWQILALHEDLWQAAAALPDDFEPTAWDTLLLDALDLLPEVGPALVLASAAVETRIESALDVLASELGVPTGLWDWLNGRGSSPRRGPTLVEQADSLLRDVAGHSLKDDRRLWDAFQDLRKARNSFVHEGAAKIDGVVVTAERAHAFLPLAGEIIEWIERLLPDGHQRPRYEAEGERFVEVTKWMTKPSPDAVAPEASTAVDHDR
jgi:hypothetical protein